MLILAGALEEVVPQDEPRQTSLGCSQPAASVVCVGVAERAEQRNGDVKRDEVGWGGGRRPLDEALDTDGSQAKVSGPQQPCLRAAALRWSLKFLHRPLTANDVSIQVCVSSRVTASKCVQASDVRFIERANVVRELKP